MELEVFKRLELFAGLVNNFWGDLIVPVATAAVVVLIVGFVYCSLTLHNVLPVFLYAFFPTASITVSVLAIGLIYRQLASISPTSEAVVAQMRVNARLLALQNPSSSKLLRMRIRSIRRIAVRCGSFGYIVFNTQAEMVEQCVNYILLLLNW